MLKFLKALLHTRECCLAVSMLRAPLCSSDGNTGRAMHQAHAGFDFIAMLPARPARDEKLYIAVTFERFTVGWIERCQGVRLSSTL